MSLAKTGSSASIRNSRKLKSSILAHIEPLPLKKLDSIRMRASLLDEEELPLLVCSDNRQHCWDRDLALNVAPSAIVSIRNNLCNHEMDRLTFEGQDSLGIGVKMIICSVYIFLHSLAVYNDTCNIWVHKLQLS